MSGTAVSTDGSAGVTVIRNPIRIKGADRACPLCALVARETDVHRRRRRPPEAAPAHARHLGKGRDNFPTGPERMFRRSQLVCAQGVVSIYSGVPQMKGRTLGSSRPPAERLGRYGPSARPLAIAALYALSRRRGATVSRTTPQWVEINVAC